MIISESMPASPFHVRVVVAESPITSGRFGDMSALERKRTTCWRNNPRNALIAKIARAFAASDVRPLWEAGLLLDENKLPPLRAPLWVAVLVESLQHGRAIAAELPTWEFWHSDPQSDVQHAIEPLFWQTRSTIITTTRASQLDNFSPSVIVNAMATESVLILPTLAMPRITPEMFVVEIADDFDKRAEAATRKRLTSYVTAHCRVDAARRWRTWERPIHQ